MLTILPSSSTRAILLTSLAIYSCIPLKAIQYYIIIPDEIFLYSVWHCFDALLHNSSSLMSGSSFGRAESVLDSHTTGPGFKTRLLRYFLPSFLLATTIPESVERSPVYVEGRGRISRSGRTQHVPHQWIAQRHVGLVSV